MTVTLRAHRDLRPGVTLPEMILVAALFAFVLLALARFAVAQGRLVARTADRARGEDVVRVARLVLDRELRAVSAGDIAASGGDSIRLRAIRGGGPVCPGSAGAAGEVVVRYRGARLPDPGKDSLLLVHSGAAAGTPRQILAVAADEGCEGGVRLTLSGAVPAAGLALVFEIGSYSLSGGALRYRRGAAGRQPLTEALLAASDLEAVNGGFVARIRFSPDSLPRAGASERHLRVQLRNRYRP